MQINEILRVIIAQICQGWFPVTADCENTNFPHPFVNFY